MKVAFVEEQKFTQWWLWLLLFAITAVPLFAFIEGGTLPSATFVIVMGLIIVLFGILKLKTRIDKECISMIYFPFIKKSVGWDQISEASVIDYGFVGGWGIRVWTKYGTVYNVRGKIGLLLKLKNGKSFVIGTQKEAELRDALKMLEKIK